MLINKADMAGLKKLFAVTQPWVCGYVRSVGIFLNFGEGQSLTQGLTAF